MTRPMTHPCDRAAPVPYELVLVEREPVQVVLSPERRLDPLRVVKDSGGVGRAFLESGLACVLDVIVEISGIFGEPNRGVALVAMVKRDILVCVCVRGWRGSRSG